MRMDKLLKDQAKELKILYVEDEPLIQKTVSTFLLKFFLKVTIANDGKEGIREYKDYKQKTKSYFDLVITDINMPNMDGIEMIREIVKINKEQKILVMSAHDNSESLLDLINLRVQRFILKPIVHRDVVKILFSLCREINDYNLLNHYYNQTENLLDELSQKNRQLEMDLHLCQAKVNCLENGIGQTLATPKPQESSSKKEIKNLSNKHKDDLRFSKIDKIDAVSYVETLDDTVIDRIENFLSELDRLALAIYKLEDCAIDDPSININEIIDVFRAFTDIIDGLTTFPITVRAFTSLISFLESLDLSFGGDVGKKKLFETVLTGLAKDLDDWIKNIFIDMKTPDIHYFDSSFANNCLEFEAMFNNVEIESDEDDLEFF